MIFKIIGGLLILVGVVDFAGSYMDFDLWGTLGVPLPEFVWRYSHFIAGGLGLVIWGLGSATDGGEEA